MSLRALGPGAVRHLGQGLGEGLHHEPYRLQLLGTGGEPLNVVARQLHHFRDQQDLPGDLVEPAALVRGLRQVSDFDYEFRMAFANRKLYPDVETVLFMTSEAHAFVSASIVRDVHRWGGDVSMFVPPPVVAALAKKRSAYGDAPPAENG